MRRLWFTNARDEIIPPNGAHRLFREAAVWCLLVRLQIIHHTATDEVFARRQFGNESGKNRLRIIAMIASDGELVIA